MYYLLMWSLLVALASGAGLLPAEMPNEPLLKEGLEFADAGQIELALISYDRYKQEHPQDPRPYLYSGLVLISSGQTKDAGMELDLAAGLKPSDPELVYDLAKALDRIGSSRTAFQLLDETEDTDRLSVDALLLLARLHLRLRQFDMALAILDMHEKLADPKLEEVGLLRGEILTEAGQLERAMEAFEAVTSSNPGSAPAFYGLMRVCALGNNPEAARDMGSKAVNLDPTEPKHLQLLGAVEKDLGLYEESILHLKESLVHGGDPLDIYFHLGDALRKKGAKSEAQEAMAKYQDLLEERRKEQEITQLVNEAQQLLDIGLVGEARASLMKVLEIEPEHWLSHNLLSKIYLSSGRPRLAHEQLQIMERLAPRSSEGYLLLAYYWYDRKNYIEARKSAEKSKALRPGNSDLRNLLGNVYYSLQEKQLALAEYKAAMRLAPDRTEFQINYDSLAKKLGRE
ncbi:MAG TPA: tetratricopeptide repeat protein [Acidobacteriota bacterium]|nr:tetratricopeptide repeat protein [Acidobacteriota bacterium]